MGAGPFAPYIAVALVLVLVVAMLSAAVWVWAMRRPRQAVPASAEPEPVAPRRVIVAVVGVGGVAAADQASGVGRSGPDWVDALQERLAPGVHVVRVAASARSLEEVGDDAVQEIVALGVRYVALPPPLSAATGGTPLKGYVPLLRGLLDRLVDATEAEVVVLGLPDVTLTLEGLSEERRRLVRGGIAQWNGVMREALTRYGRRVSFVDLYSYSEALYDPEGGSRAMADLIWREIAGELVARRGE